MNEILHGDCLELMRTLPDNSVDMVLADLPYEVTQHKLDKMIDPVLLWESYWRIVKPNAAVVLFGQDKFTATMMLSDKNHKYNLIWDKVLTTGFLNANRMPLRSHEDIMVFYRNQPVYNPQKARGRQNHSKGEDGPSINNNYGKFGFRDNRDDLQDMKHPKSILQFQKPHPSTALHRTEKPVDLLRYLINTFTNEGELVLDNAAGSGTTAIACLKENRNFIVMEKDQKYYDIIKQRVSEHKRQLKLF